MIYAVNKQTKEHLVCGMSIKRPDAQWDFVEADAEGWIEWHGGECPLPYGQMCEVRLRLLHKPPAAPSAYFRWNLAAKGEIPAADIIAYRPILESQPSEWRGPQDGLPPVGWCGAYSPLWHACEVVAYHKGFVVVWDAHDLEYFRTKDPSIFRPIRTDREEWINRALHLIQPTPSPKMLAEAIYDALKSGDLPQP